MRLRVIDIETSGGEPSEIIEIAAVDVVADPGGWIAEPPRSILFAPRGPISVHAMAIHHLTPAHLAGVEGPCDDGALAAFLSDGGRPDALVAHNASFERQHIGAGVTAGLPWICTLKAARAAWPEAPGHSNQVLRYWRGLDLDPALAMPPHRAGPDAWVTAHILLDLLRTASADDLLAWSLAPRSLDRVPFGRHRGEPWRAVPSPYLDWLMAEPEMAQDVADRARAERAGRTREGAAPEA